MSTSGQQQRRSSLSGTDFNASSGHPPLAEGASRLPVPEMNGPRSRSPQRVPSFTSFSPRVPNTSPLEPSGFDRGPTQGASRVDPGRGRRESVSNSSHRLGGRVAVKFRLPVNGVANSGISVRQALDRAPLSQSGTYSLHDIASNSGGTISLRVCQNGYRMKTYVIQLSSDHEGHVDLQSLARRTARAIVHYMQHSGINVIWDRVVIQRLEQIGPGVWIPVLTIH